MKNTFLKKYLCCFSTSVKFLLIDKNIDFFIQYTLLAHSNAREVHYYSHLRKCPVFIVRYVIFVSTSKNVNP